MTKSLKNWEGRGGLQQPKLMRQKVPRAKGCPALHFSLSLAKQRLHKRCVFVSTTKQTQKSKAKKPGLEANGSVILAL